MKRWSCLVLVAALLNSCMTALTLDAAKGKDITKQSGESVPGKKPNPAAYALLPAAVAADTVLAALWAAAMFGAL